MNILEIPAPTFEWFELLPLIVVLAGACVGVLLEAFLPRALRFFGQLLVMAATVLGALAALVINWLAGRTGVFAMGSLALDGPSYVMWAALLVFGLLAMLVFGERALDHGRSAFAPLVSANPGSDAEQEDRRGERAQQEVLQRGLLAVQPAAARHAAEQVQRQ